METKSIKTPSGVEVILKAWITGAESMKIEAPFQNLKMTLDTTGIGKGEVNAGEAAEKSRKIAIEVIVVSVNGKTEKLYEEIIALRKTDYQFVLKEIDKIIKDEDFPLPAETQEGGIA